MFQPPRHQQAGLDPRVVDSLLDAYLNVLAHDAEEPFWFTAERFTRDDHRIGAAVQRSAESGKVQRFSDVAYGFDWVLSGYESVAQDNPTEIGMIVWSDETDPHLFRYLAAEEGTRSSVTLPMAAALPKLQHRATCGIATRVMVVHNHPRHPLRSLAEEALGVCLGPSGTDREVMWEWVNLSWQSGFVIEPEFWLYESGEWRRFRWPPVSQWKAWLAMFAGRSS